MRYFSPDSIYAAGYATCIIGTGSGAIAVPDKDDDYAMILCAICPGLCYPLSSERDIVVIDDEKGQSPTGARCRFFGLPLCKLSNDYEQQMIFNSHCAGVSPSEDFTLPNKDYKYIELVVEESSQVLPLAVVYFKPKFGLKALSNEIWRELPKVQSARST